VIEKTEQLDYLVIFVYVVICGQKWTIRRQFKNIWYRSNPLHRFKVFQGHDVACYIYSHLKWCFDQSQRALYLNYFIIIMLFKWCIHAFEKDERKVSILNEEISMEVIYIDLSFEI